MKRSFCLLVLLCLYRTPHAQSLTAADSLPAVAITAIQKTLPNYQCNDPLILAFWATWCTACSRSMRRIDSLQQLTGSIPVLWINTASTGDDSLHIARYQQRRFLKNPQAIPFLNQSADTLFDRLFPHQYIPHYIWLAKGQVYAITSADAFTAATIREWLAVAKPPATTPKELPPEKPTSP